MTHVYILFEESAEKTGPTKVGTAVNVAYRLDSLRCGNPRRLVLFHSFRLGSRDDALRLEKAILSKLTRVGYGRDWVLQPAADVLIVARQCIAESTIRARGGKSWIAECYRGHYVMAASND